MRYFLIALTILVFPFLEHLFRGGGFVSLFTTVVLTLHIVLGFRSFLIPIIVLSFILDTTFHQFFGTHLLAVGMMLLIYEILDRVIPSETSLLRSIVVFLSLLTSMLVSHFAVAVSFNEGFHLQTGSLMSFALKAVMGVVIYHIASFVVDNMRTDNRSTLKMR